MIKKLFFGAAWFILFLVGACVAVSVYLGSVTGDPTLTSEAANLALQDFMNAHVLKLFAGSLLLAIAGTVTGLLPGTRTSRATALVGEAPALVGRPGASPKAFGVREGVVAFVAFVAMQFVVFFVIGLVAVAEVGAHATAQLNARVVELTPTGFLLTYVAVAVVLFGFFRGYARRPDWPTIEHSFALAWGTARANATGLFCGMLLGTAYMTLGPLAADPAQAGPTVTGTMVTTPAGLMAWATTAVLLAPPTEELLFRSLLIRSFASKLSLPVAAFVSGTLFWAIHLPETMSYWPAVIGVALIAVVTTVLRISTGALGPAIAGHVGYNLVIAALVMRASAG